MKKLKKIISAALLMTIVMNVGFSAPSHALVGLIFRSRTVKTVGAIGAAAGGTISIVSYVTALNATNIGALIAGAIWTGWGVIIAGIGLVVLDDQKSIADIEFRAINPNQPELYQGLTREQVEIYNSELDQLNSIRQTMIAESNTEADTSDAEALWKNYSTLLNPATVQVAQKVAVDFLKAIH